MRLTCIALLIFAFRLPASAQETWKVGIARTKITPTESVWMAGYGSRTKPSEGTLHDLWGKALAFEDAQGKKALFVTTDILGFSKEVSDRVRQHLQNKHGLSKAQIILSSSHTHSGPVLSNALVDIYPMDDAQRAQVARYTAYFEQEIIRLCEEALKSMKPAKLFSGNGVLRFAVNRRNNEESQIADLFELKGPSDHAVPVIKVMNQSNEVTAILFGYTCHTTVLSSYLFSGDYAGFAQLELEKLYPKATALFFQGSAGDQNPLPRRTVAIARQYGKELAAAVESVIEEPMNALSSRLSTTYSEIDLAFNPAPTREQLEKKVAATSGYEKRWAERMLDKVKKNEPLMKSYPYPVQVWMIGEQPVFSLGGEVTVEYTVKIKEMFGKHVFVAAYTNDVMGYIPSLRVWKEGRYEGETSQMVYGLPAKWHPSIESSIMKEVADLSKKAGVPTR
ncbi:hypothetical protein GCM10023091_05440 [Ravibacter arvi]|uniref:Neutral ceramidase n=1 Tax=Ravibacter arvi TaxID=2051041 RepID=A0ABP8LNM7_9BACT